MSDTEQGESKQRDSTADYATLCAAVFAREEALLAPYAMRSADSAGRKHAEPPHAYRTPFQRDRDRVERLRPANGDCGAKPSSRSGRG